MNIQPYKSIDSLLFKKSTNRDCVKLYGNPQRINTNRYGVEEYYYPDFIIRFASQTGTLQECTILPYKDVTIANILVTWDFSFLKKACQLDGEPYDILGFIVMRNIGLAVTGIHDGDKGQLAITVFSPGDFDDLMGDAKPFDVDSFGNE